MFQSEKLHPKWEKQINGCSLKEEFTCFKVKNYIQNEKN